MYSKETLDKVKLAKQYIENRYQTILQQQKQNKNYWNKILLSIDPSCDDLEQITQHIYYKQNINKRLQRQKDKLQNYKLYNIIGRGAFGEVRLARNIVNNQIVAIKRLQKKYLIERKQIYNAYIQRDFMTKVNSDLIVQLKSAFQDQEYLYIVMEYVPGGDLLHLLVQKDIFTQNQTRFYIAELVLAIQQIHKLNYIHRDIKPDNILIDKNGHLKISDFGLSKYLPTQTYLKSNKKQNTSLSKLEKLKKLTHIKNKQKNFSKVGTPDYISPEVLTQKTYTHSIDLWGVGVIMFECLYGYPPFTHEDSKEVCQRVLNWVQYLQFPDYIQASTPAKMLMLGLMNHSRKRLTIPQIKKHPFFSGINWQKIRKQKAPMIPKIKNDLDSSNFDSFQLKNPWTPMQRQLFLQMSLSKTSKNKQNYANVTEIDQQFQIILKESQSIQSEIKQRKSLGANFRFVGYDFRSVDKNPLELIAKQLARKSESKKRIKQNISNSYKLLKCQRLKTQQCNKYKKNKLLTQGSSRSSIKTKIKPHRMTQKTRPSQLTTTNNNIINQSQICTFKQIINKICDKQNKQNSNSINKITKQSKQINTLPIKKSIEKMKIEKMKQLFSSLSSNKKSNKMLEITQNQLLHVTSF